MLYTFPDLVQEVKKLRESALCIEKVQDEDTWHFITRYSEDWRMSRNGGDYTFWTTVSIDKDCIRIFDDCSGLLSGSERDTEYVKNLTSVSFLRNSIRHNLVIK